MGQRFMSVVLAGLFGMGLLGTIAATPTPAAAQVSIGVGYRSPGVRIGVRYGAPYYGHAYYTRGYYYPPAYYSAPAYYYPPPTYYAPYGGWVVVGGWWGYHDRYGRFHGVRRYRR